MKILVACEYSGRVREAFRKLGHDAWSCDLLPSDDNSPFHIQGGELKEVGKAFGQPIYARIKTDDPDAVEYEAKRLSSMMSNFITGEPEEITLDGKIYTVVLKTEV